MADEVVEIYNVTRQAPLADRARMADSHRSRTLGLIGSPPPGPSEALVIDPSMGIHTWFMSYPIDVVYVGKNDRVLDIDEAIPPWRFGKIRFRAIYVIEMAAGAVKERGIRVGDELKIRRPAQRAA
jgi:uncharacterized membrane protein (UPF0127 family)